MQLQNKTERFRYDDLERVTCAYFSAVENALAPCAQSFGYAPNGNLLTKSDIGSLSYGDLKHPHAVTSVGAEIYAYNAVGNQITRPGGVAIAYTPFDLPKAITINGTATTFGYDGEQKRIRKTAVAAETIYFGEIFEQVANGALKEFRYYVHSPERVIAVVTRAGNDPGTKYLHVDHLGSVESVTNDSGVVVDMRSFDVYGGRRNPKWGTPGGITTSNTPKGYTGHEEEDEFGLVNMRGRLMDPRLGRFTTTDPVIADLGNGQTLNRYSYVNGNPLAFVDPTGFSPDPAPIMPVGSSVHTLPNGVIDVDIWYSPRPQQEIDLTDALESTNSLRFTSDVDSTGDGGSDLPQEIAEPEGRSIGQLMGGYLFGVAEGLVPFAALGHGIADEYGFSRNKYEEARIGLAIGQIVGDVPQKLASLLSVRKWQCKNSHEPLPLRKWQCKNSHQPLPLRKWQCKNSHEPLPLRKWQCKNSHQPSPLRNCQYKNSHEPLPLGKCHLA